jgi:ABC-type dipeptide/oligopeptide/nickel transport system permease component
MARYAVRRFLQGLISLFVLGTIVFCLARLIGNPVDLLLPPDATVANRQQLMEQLGLDRPYPVQYAEFIGATLRGNLGTSIRYKRPVATLFFERLPNSLSLIAFALLIALCIGFPLGVLAGTNQGKLIDRVASAFAVIGISAPSFWVGLVLMEIFAVKLRLLPSARMGGIEYYILPGVTLALMVVPGMVRLLRSGMIDALGSEFVKLARIKGVSRRLVIWKHALRNSLIPVVTFVGMHVALMLGGAIVIETIFAWPGVGRLAYEGIQGRDYPLVQGVVLMKGAMIVAMNFLVDISYSYIDPRIRYE